MHYKETTLVIHRTITVRIYILEYDMRQQNKKAIISFS